MRLLFAKDAAEVDAWRDRGARAGDAVFPLMPKAALRLREITGELPPLAIDLLAREERDAIGPAAEELSRTWHLGLAPSLVAEGVDLLACCRLQMLGFFQDLLAAEAAVPRIIAARQPREAVFFRAPSVPSHGLTAHDGTADVLEAVLQHRLAAAGVTVSVLEPAPRERLARRLGAFAPAWALRAARRARARLRARPPSSQRLAPAAVPRDRPLVAAYGSGYDLLLLWPYAKALAAETGSFPLLVSSDADLDASTLRSGLLADPAARYLHLDDIAPAGGRGPDLRRLRARCLAALRAGEALPPPLRNPLLRFQLAFLFDVLLPEALEEARRATGFFRAFRPNILLDDYCAGVPQRAWAGAAAREGVATVTVPHGAVNLVEFHEYRTDWALAWGELGRRNWARAVPEKASRVIVAGDPSMEGLRQRFAGIGGGRGGDAVLLLTGGIPQQAWTNVSLGGFIRTWEGIVAAARARPEISFIVKTHPGVRDLGPWYRALVSRERLANVTVVERDRLEDLLPRARFAILVGKPGTAALVAALAGVPFLYLDTMHGRAVPGLRIWDDANGVPRLVDPAGLGAIIDDMNRNPEARERVRAENRRFLNLYLQPFRPELVARALGLAGAGAAPAPGARGCDAG